MIVIRGTVDWCKLLGEPRPHTGLQKYDKGPSWGIDITPDAKSRQKISEAGISDKLRTPKGEKERRTETYLSFKHLQKKKDGTNNPPPKISDIKGNLWGGAEIGNGSICDIKAKVVDYGDTQGLYFQEMRVLEHVVYEGGGGFEPLSEDDIYFASSGKAEPKGLQVEDLDDDSIPF